MDKPQYAERSIRPWRFEAAWLQSEQCEGVVEEGWGSCLGQRGGLGVAEQIERCKASLKKWRLTTRRTSKHRVQYLENKLARLLKSRISPEINHTIAEIREELERGAAHEETVWKQRSKVLWLREGDRNTGFFHRRASTRFQTNLIRKIKRSNGTWVTTEEGIRQCISAHFGGVYASNRPQPEAIAKGTEHLRPVVDASMADELLQPYTATEVFLDRIISPAQSAFVPGRLISDNVLLAFELNHFLNTKTRGERGWMALKLDVSKAYDKVEWSFLEQFGSLVPERGLRQGDPLSPYLFITQSFSSLTECKEKGAFRGRAELTIRREKQAAYLGLPTRARHLFDNHQDRIWQKITGWNDKLLSQAGKEILIKAVLQAVPSYAMGCFRLPVSLLKELQGMISRFWWSNRALRRQEYFELATWLGHFRQRRPGSRAGAGGMGGSPFSPHLARQLTVAIGGQGCCGPITPVPSPLDTCC
ncbi:hypothetical protein Sango_1816800 [Sesamum angolense]|uniref:Reverse transcriptase domain-containing protein n=1 Tax=Sesamum angolense TaxID=2727404 RepID=A0AAE1WHH6_9LAMI|nr:hypothetical protein Sango_1816800 [Sesamum angolense]